MKKRKISALLLCLVLFMATSLQAKAASAPVSLQIEVKTELTGDNPPTPEIFSFVLEAVDHAPMPENNTITISGEGRSFFPSINYTEPETYSYTVREINGGTEGYIYDDTIYDVTVQITTDDGGNLTATQCVSIQGDNVKEGEIVFTNQYKTKGHPVPGSTTGTASAKTGDQMQPEFWIIVNILALLVVAILLVLIRKNRKRHI